MFSGPLLFLEAQQYSAHPEQVVLLLPADFSHQAKPGPDPYLHQRLEVNLSQYYPMQIWTVDDLAQHRAQSALIEPDETALKDLGQAGVPVTNRFAQPVQVDYLQ